MRNYWERWFVIKKILIPAAPSPPEESSFAEVVALIQPKLSPLLRVFPGTHNLLIMGRSKRQEWRRVRTLDAHRGSRDCRFTDSTIDLAHRLESWLAQAVIPTKAGIRERRTTDL